eukprot:TRINITY_DN23175_c1_g1_i1.p1 TRINITY_DN23175_c1_g1~~TRINITY_DN23175_c1_g1_i1.p1  ORF type:complete len:974 (+),score=258.09 TRINITY_DN23175_c1_g1_i1:399-3320(+)
MQLVSCQPIDVTGNAKTNADEYLMLATNVKCVMEGLWLKLSVCAIIGMIVWTLGILFGLVITVAKNEMNSHFIQRNFGYILEGYEPRVWHWEVTAKKIDLFIMALVAYTSIAADPRTKLLLYALWSLIIIMIQIAFVPYDNRSINLLDRIENLGLIVRAMLFVGIKLCLLFTPGKQVVDGMAWLTVIAAVAWCARLALHICDDLVQRQMSIVQSKVALLWKERRRYTRKKVLRMGKALDEAEQYYEAARKTAKMIESSGRWHDRNELLHLEGVVAQAKANYDVALTEFENTLMHLKGCLLGVNVQAPELTGYGQLLNLYLWILSIPQKAFFVHYRHRQHLTFRWRGPTSDAFLHRPMLHSGAGISESGELDKMPFYVKLQLQSLRSLYNLDPENQLSFVVSSISDFLHLLIFGAEFESIPNRMTDLIMLLSLGIKRWRHSQIHDPPLPPRKEKKKASRHKETTVKVVKTEEDEEQAEMNAEANAEAEAATAHLAADFAQDNDASMKIDSGSMAVLKARLIEEVLSKIQSEYTDRRNLLKELRLRLRPDLRDRAIPEELCDEILQRMTTDQLRRLKPHPKQILVRLNLFQLLLQCEHDEEGTLKRSTTLARIKRDKQVDSKERLTAMHLMAHSLRSSLEKQTDVHWNDVKTAMAKLPVEEVLRLSKSQEECVGILQEQQRLEREMQSTSDSFDSVTVEDLNSLLIFIFQVEWKDFKDLMEYAQLLLDFVQLPHKPIWTDENFRQQLVEHAGGGEEPTGLAAIGSARSPKATPRTDNDFMMEAYNERVETLNELRMKLGFTEEEKAAAKAGGVHFAEIEDMPQEYAEDRPPNRYTFGPSLQAWRPPPSRHALDVVAETENQAANDVPSPQPTMSKVPAPHEPAIDLIDHWQMKPAESRALPRDMQPALAPKRDSRSMEQPRGSSRPDHSIRNGPASPSAGSAPFSPLNAGSAPFSPLQGDSKRSALEELRRRLEQ